VQKSNAQTTPSPRNSSGADLKVKPMLDGRAYAREKIHPKAIITNVRRMPLA